MSIVFNNCLEKERRGKSCCLYMYNHDVQIPEEILGTIAALVSFFPSLSCLLVTFLPCVLVFLVFFLCLHVLVNKIVLNKTPTCHYITETMQLKITKILITNSIF